MAAQPVADQQHIATERERFLAAGRDEDIQVRRMILASWYRSRENHVDIERIHVPHVPDWDLEAPLKRSADAILTRLEEQLHNEPVSIILTDQTGMVLDRRCSAMGLTDILDTVSLAPGYSYAEQFVGTNGIGTALSSGTPALVTGREHYTGALGQFACAGVPIRHPTGRRVAGLLDLTSWSAASGSLLMALAVATAAQIEEELRAQTGLREIALLEAYLAACRQSPRPVLALNGDVVMTNEHLRALLDTAEQQSLTSHAADTVASTHHPTHRTVDLPSGRVAHLSYTPTTSEAGPAGGVFRIRLGDSPTRSGHGPAPAGQRRPPTLRGIVGASPGWTRCVAQINSCYLAGEWLAIHGEPGTGKRALLRAVHAFHEPGHGFRILDPPCGDEEGWFAELSEAVSVPAGMVVLAHAEQLGEQTAAAVADLLTGLADADVTGCPVRVALTVVDGEVGDVLAALFPRSIELPPLRHHNEDMGALVAHLLGQLPGGARLSVSPAALSQLARAQWPGNVTQLRAVLKNILKIRHAGVIEVADLPPEVRTVVRRMLSPIEWLEHDAIVTALLENDESPTRAAEAIGISRATIYRKLRRYGITLPLQL